MDGWMDHQIIASIKGALLFYYNKTHPSISWNRPIQLPIVWTTVIVVLNYCFYQSICQLFTWSSDVFFLFCIVSENSIESPLQFVRAKNNRSTFFVLFQRAVWNHKILSFPSSSTKNSSECWIFEKLDGENVSYYCIENDISNIW